MAVLGVDMHKDTHVAIVLDEFGRVQVASSFGTSDRDNHALISWAQAHGPITRAGVEGTGSYGYRLARTLTDAGVEVIEVSRPDRARRRRKGKTDLVDAEARPAPYWPTTRPRFRRIDGGQPGNCAASSSRDGARSRPAPRLPTRSRRCWSTATTTCVVV
ncbi:MAG: transposase [Actinomycetota bacterium]|nr:transposase [Actinomycetota bacterium]